MNVRRIHVTANIDVGGYCWAKYGFSTTRQGAIDTINESLSRAYITKAQHEEALSIITKYGKETFPMNLLAELPYSEKMLKGLTWDGFLDLSDRGQLLYMKKYIGYSK